MTTFINGPAHGLTLMLKGSPLYLRVVDNGKQIDALDQPKDRPEKNETITVYRRSAYHGGIHVNPGGFYPRSEYTYMEVQPSNDVLADQVKWLEWVVETKWPTL